ncbi:MAG: hypothetical protein V4498_01620 [candidate division FCPU426 bacterium]
MTDSSEKNFNRLAILFLAAQVLFNFSLFGLWQQHLPGFDETRYFQYGQELWHGNLRPWNWSPAMALFYAPFAGSWAQPDWSHRLIKTGLALFIVVLLYKVLRRSNNRVLALGCASLIAWNAQFLFTWTVHLAGMALSLTALYLFLKQRGGAALALLILGTLLRPEFLPFSAVCTLLALTPLGKALHVTWKLPALAAIFLLGYALVYPDQGGTARQAEAFQQHYAWTHNDLGDWSGDHWLQFHEVVIRDFGRDDLSVAGFAKANPMAFAGHVFHNLILIPKSLSQSLGVRFKIPFLACMVVLFAWWRLGFREQNTARETSMQDRENALGTAQVLSLASVGFFGVWLLIRPTPAYLHLANPFYLLAITAWLAWRIKRV